MLRGGKKGIRPIAARKNGGVSHRELATLARLDAGGWWSWGDGGVSHRELATLARFRRGQAPRRKQYTLVVFITAVMVPPLQCLGY